MSDERFFMLKCSLCAIAVILATFLVVILEAAR